MKKLLWLDDYRDPLGYCPGESKWAWTFSPIQQPFEVIWVKSYNEFVAWITTNGLPDAICFDHDLGDYQAFRNGYPEYFDGQPWPEHELTGYDCAKWLVNYCMDHNKELPKYNMQSANPVGKANIDGVLKSYIKHVQNNIAG